MGADIVVYPKSGMSQPIHYAKITAYSDFPYKEITEFSRLYLSF